MYRVPVHLTWRRNHLDEYDDDPLKSIPPWCVCPSPTYLKMSAMPTKITTNVVKNPWTDWCQLDIDQSLPSWITIYSNQHWSNVWRHSSGQRRLWAYLVKSVQQLVLSQSHLIYQHGAYITNYFSIVIHIWQKICFLANLFIAWSLQSFTHATTAVLPWHVQNFVAITLFELGWGQHEVFIEFELWWKNH